MGGILAVGFVGQIAGTEALLQLVKNGAMGVKIEPAKGDPKRKNGTRTAYRTFNAGTYSVTFGSNPEDDQTKYRLLRKADVIIDNRSPESRKKDTVLQRVLASRQYPVVYCGISGYGPNSNNNKKKAYDRVIQAVTGMAYLNKDRNNIPQFINFPLIDICSGKEAAKQIAFSLVWLNSLTEKEKQRLSFISLEISMFAVTVDLLSNSVANYIDTHETTSSIVPFGLYPTKSEKIAVAVATDVQFAL